MALRYCTRVIVLVALFLHVAALHAGEVASCTFDTFSAPVGYSFTQIEGISDDGTVVGQLVENQTQQWLAFSRSAGGVITMHSAPGSSSTWLYGRNGVGDNTGFYQDRIHPERVHGFILQGAKFTLIDHPRAVNTWLFGMNQLGVAVGSYSASASVIKGFMLLNGEYTTIGVPDAQVTYALGINDNSDVIGTYASGPVSNGFLWSGGNFTTINYPNSKYGTVLAAINNAGVIVGNHLSKNKDSGFIYENGIFKDIVYPDAQYATVGGINNNGVISGQIYLLGSTTLGYTAICK
jgi:uncharacterized membrane protein